MDIRSYFKGDGPVGPTPPSSPPKPARPALFELPDFLFISAGSGLKRDRSTVAENVEDAENKDDFNYNVHRVLSPLEVVRNGSAATKLTKTINDITTKKKRNRANKDDGFSFSNDMEDRFKMLATYKEKKAISEKDEVEQGNKRKKIVPPNNKDTAEQSKNKFANAPLVPHAITQKQVPITQQHPIVQQTHQAPKTPKSTQPIPHTTPKNVSSETTPAPKNISSKATPPILPPPSLTKTRTNDVELENKIKEKMDTVQLWQNNCTELRKQLTYATAQLTQSLDELDHLNSLYEDSNN